MNRSPVHRRRPGRAGAHSPLARVRALVARIPLGRVATYGEIAAAAGFPGAARLTVRALQRTEGLPWHRVVAAGGRVALPGDAGAEQRLRLEIEGVRFRGGRVLMEEHGWRPPVRGSGGASVRRKARRPSRAAPQSGGGR